MPCHIHNNTLRAHILFLIVYTNINMVNTEDISPVGIGALLNACAVCVVFCCCRAYEITKIKWEKIRALTHDDDVINVLSASMYTIRT